MIRRPEAMWIDMQTCICCGVCDELVPGILEDARHVPVTEGTLEAMAACPVGAIRWLEGDPPMQQLDVRTIPPRERHPRIFQMFDALSPGQAFELVNDHDPKPLYYQFQAERPGLLDWQYLEEGPERWRVRIGRAG